MAFQVVHGLARDDIPLENEADMRGQCGQDFILQKRVMGTGQQHCVDIRVSGQEANM